MQHPTGTVTFLFTDIEGSTKRWEAYPQQMRSALSRHDAILRSAIEEQRGYIFKTVGDAFCVAFSTPHVALRAALDLQRALLQEEWPPEIGQVRVRAALHTGAVEEQGGDYFGQPLNRVARLLSAGHGGQVLLSNPTHDLVRDNLPAGATITDLGEHRLKDLIRPERIFQLAAPGLTSEFPPLNTLDNRPNNLPLQPTPFIGREKEVAQAVALVRKADTRIVTLTGPGGTGKTRLALQVGSELLDEFPDGVWFVELASLVDHSLVTPTIASALGVTEQGGAPILQSLERYLTEKHTLLLLDNFEQVVEAAEQVSQLAATCPHLKLLVTSRVPLRIRGEKEYAVTPLKVPDTRPGHLPPLEQLTQYEAVSLFIQRATDVKADFQVTNDNAPAVAEICARLDGLPLAIELAAARVRMLSPEALLPRLSQRLKVLTGGARDLPARQQTLRNTIEWSYDLLDEGEKQLFRRMAPFNGGRSLEALEAVCNSGALQIEGPLAIDVFEGVGSLLSKNLLREVEGSRGEPRFRMLETIHEYARERLWASGEEAELRRRHARYFLELVEQAAPHLKQIDQARWLEQLEDEHDNIRAAFQWAREYGEAGDSEAAEIGLRLAIGLERFWQVRVYLREGLEQTVGVLAIGRPGGATRANALTVAGTLADICGDHATARSMHEESIKIWRELGDKRSLVGALHALGLVYFSEGDFNEARSHFEEGFHIEEELGERKDSLHDLGIVFYELGDYASAASFLERDLAIQREVGDTRREALALANLGLVAFEQSDYELALSRHRESLAIRQTLGAKRGFVYSLEGLAMVYRGLGKPDVAAKLWGASQAMRDAMGAPVPPNERARYRREMDMVRVQLGEEGFQRAYAEGCSMTSEQAVAVALG